MSIQFTPDAPATRRAFNRLAREKMKLRLLADIRMDLVVCELEGWDKLEYLDELLALVQELRKGGGGRMKEKPVLSINITEKTFCLCMLAAQQLLNTINSKKSFRAIVERSPEAEKITIKIYTKDIPVE